VELAERLRAKGHRVAELDFDVGSKPLDKFIDIPPFIHDWTPEQRAAWGAHVNHIKVAVDGVPCTCFGLLVVKQGESQPRQVEFVQRGEGRFYPAECFRSSAGSARNGVLTLPVGAGDGHLIYGPYVALETGRYRARFRFAAASCAAGTEAIVLEVIDTTDRFLAKESVARGELDGAGPLSFEHVNPDAKLEFRVHLTGRLQQAPLLFEGVEVEPEGDVVEQPLPA
jgi:hypothetical protein